MCYTPPKFLSISIHNPVISILSTSRVENCVDPDQQASEKPADLDLHCFKIRMHPCMHCKVNLESTITC